MRRQKKKPRRSGANWATQTARPPKGYAGTLILSRLQERRLYRIDHFNEKMARQVGNDDARWPCFGLRPA
jgi:hypothetical protein